MRMMVLHNISEVKRRGVYNGIKNKKIYVEENRWEKKWKQ